MSKHQVTVTCTYTRSHHIKMLTFSNDLFLLSPSVKYAQKYAFLFLRECQHLKWRKRQDAFISAKDTREIFRKFLKVPPEGGGVRGSMTSWQTRGRSEAGCLDAA